MIPQQQGRSLRVLREDINQSELRINDELDRKEEKS